MELKRATKKLPSEQNLRLLANLIVSISSKQSALEDKCITEWEPDVAYIRNQSYVTHENKLYVCVVSCSDSVWNPLHFQVLSDEINEIDLDTVKSWLNLSQEELDNLQKLLKDDQITTTSTFSSSKIYSDLQAAIDTAKEYTNNQLGKAVKPAYKVVASTSEVTETGYFYLISNGTNFDMYVLSADGSVVSLGTSDVDLTQFYDKDYIDNNFYTSAQSDGKFATITTVDGKVDKTSILKATSTTATNEQVYSANVVNKSISNQGIYSGDVNEIPMIKPDVLYSYSVRYESCTNLPNLCGHGILENMYLGSIDYATQRLTTINTKTVYMRVKGGGTWGDWIKLSTAEDKMVKVNGDVLEYIKNNPQKNLTIFWDTTDTNTPYTAGFTGSGGGTLISNVFDGDWGSVIGTCGGDYFCINRLMGGTWQGWEKLCATTVADVPATNIELTDNTNYKVSDGTNRCYYVVKNGWCDFNIDFTVVTPVSNVITLGEFPTPCGNKMVCIHPYLNPSSDELNVDVNVNGKLRIWGGTAGTRYIASFSYPVKEP